MTTFVNSYYPSDAKLSRDSELQAWIAEANGPAEVIDFPSAPLTDRGVLVEILTHLAYLATVVHHTLNTNDLVESLATLPFHPASLYAPIPTAKNISSSQLLSYLPGPGPAIGQIGLTAFFNRAFFKDTNQTLSYLFDDETLMERMNEETAKAGRGFRHGMNKFSRKVRARHFDGKGLSQGMPFVWKTLDPEVAPFYLAI
jgi:hypothetical protein